MKQSEPKPVEIPSVAPAPSRLLQRKCDCGRHTAGGECGECRKGLSPEGADRSAAGPSGESRFGRDLSGVPASSDPMRGVAAGLRAAMDRRGTDEKAIFSALNGRTQGELASIREAYRSLSGTRELEADLKSELSGKDLKKALVLLQQGHLDNPEDRIWLATKGLGTDEALLFAALESLSGDEAKIRNTIDAYRDKGYGDMLKDVRGDLSGRERKRALELLHGTTTSTDGTVTSAHGDKVSTGDACSPEQRRQALLAISKAASMTQKAIAQLQESVARGALSGRVKRALEQNFNRGGRQAVTVRLAEIVIGRLTDAYDDILSKNEIHCVKPGHVFEDGRQCSTTEIGCGENSILAGTGTHKGSPVRLCKEFFTCGDQPTDLLHEFMHHISKTREEAVSPLEVNVIHLPTSDKAYKGTKAYSKLQPLEDATDFDSIYNADSYAQLVKDLS